MLSSLETPHREAYSLHFFPLVPPNGLPSQFSLGLNFSSLPHRGWKKHQVSGKTLPFPSSLATGLRCQVEGTHTTCLWGEMGTRIPDSMTFSFWNGSCFTDGFCFMFPLISCLRVWFGMFTTLDTRHAFWKSPFLQGPVRLMGRSGKQEACDMNAFFPVACSCGVS